MLITFITVIPIFIRLSIFTSQFNIFINSISICYDISVQNSSSIILSSSFFNSRHDKLFLEWYFGN